MNLRATLAQHSAAGTLELGVSPRESGDHSSGVLQRGWRMTCAIGP